jgi:SAM-dependent methyltransferase
MKRVRSSNTAEEPAFHGYDDALFQKVFAAENKHFWFRARNTLITGLARRAIAGVGSPNILEVGCGTGNVLHALCRACSTARVVGIDFSAEGFQYARARGPAPLVQADASYPPFSIKFDLVGIFDVLEHIPDDNAALESARGLLRHNGRLLVTVPANMSLWSYADEAARHCRRYNAVDLSAQLESHGFRIELISPFMAILYPALKIWRFVNRNRKKSPVELFEGDLTVVPVLNEVAQWLTSVEAQWIIAGHRLPFGTSLVVVARKE